MGFEKRKRGTYLYLSSRDTKTGAVKKVYVGRGAKAEAAGKALRERRDQRVAERLAEQRAEAELRPVDGFMAAVDEVATLLLEASLFAAGYHRANYSRWRKRRESNGHGGSRGSSPA